MVPPFSSTLPRPVVAPDPPPLSVPPELMSTLWASAPPEERLVLLSQLFNVPVTMPPSLIVITLLELQVPNADAPPDADDLLEIKVPPSTVVPPV